MEGKYGRDDDESTEDGSGSARDSVARHNVSLTSNKCESNLRYLEGNSHEACNKTWHPGSTSTISRIFLTRMVLRTQDDDI